MFVREFQTTVPANATSLALPEGTHPTADVQVTLIGEGSPLGIRHDAAKPLNLLVTKPVAAARKVNVKVSQEFPFSAEQLQPFNARVFQVGSRYKKDEVVVGAVGGLYRLPSDMNVTNISQQRDLIPITTQAGEIFMVYSSTAPVGTWPCDGSVINAPWSKYHGTTTPDLRDRFPRCASSYNPTGTKGGSDVVAIQQSDLPRVTLQGSTSYDGRHSHNLLGNAGWDGTNGVGGSDRSQNWWYGTTSTDGVHNHSVTVTLNPNQQQTSLNIRPAFVSILFVIRL